MNKSKKANLVLLFVMLVSLGIIGCSDDGDPVILSFNSGGCCVGRTGNIDGDPDDCCNADDIAYLTEFMFIGGPPPACWSETDVNGDGSCDVSDLKCLVAFVYHGGLPPVPCPGWNL